MVKAVALLLTLILLFKATLSAPTTLSYITQIQKEQSKELIEATISTHADDASLGQAILQSRSKAQSLKQFAVNTCKNLVKDSKDKCKDFAEVGKVEVKPHYKTVKKDTFYQKMSSTFSVTLKFKQMRDFAIVIDQIIKIEGIKIQKIEWVADEEEQEAKFLKECTEKADDLCKQIGKKYTKLVGIEQLRDKPEQPEQEEKPQEGEEEEQEEQQEEQEKPEEEEEKTKYCITIQCDGSVQSKKKKKQK